MILEKFKKKQIAKKSADFSRWYIDTVLQAGLADYTPVKGCIIFRPYGYALWESIQKELDGKIKKMGAKNAYFPSFIPEKLLKREKEHVEGFSPELAVVTIGGGKKLEEPLVVRPTSETIMYEMFAKWIQSWRDLPLKINQWCNVVRWEKRTLPFIRTTEFLWQEGHTAHATHKEALDQVRKAMDAYIELYRQHLALHGVAGYKSASEKFAGAERSVSYEMLMPDGRALQASTSHDLGQNFARAFEVKFQDKEGRTQYVWQTSWGLSTRALGGMIMVHGDDNGLILPPQVAPIQIVVIPIFSDSKGESQVKDFINQIKLQLSGFRVEIDNRETYSPGWKFNEWELKGVPLRRLYQRSRLFVQQNTREVNDYNEFKRIMAGPRGFIRAFWCGNPECENKIKEETKATTRCLPLSAKEEKGKCIYCGEEAHHRWLFAQAY
ncbi:proline--tRNA ligase [candidate division CPR3 bacterium 4484_211]|uniref:Proline--tRNA ligase n=1 Tax=candidate division CPR3 bacterium 4484_211 TaxID=1968527 RepID=A0A1W9NYJ1_UNCC3|nr:MAG: proline--tRNA ligase [candidate division CPR3 bacterium 4484_211]